MRFLAALPIFAATLSLSSCILGGGTKTPKTPVVPATLDPNAAAKPVAPPPPLSSPQTDIQLPPEQTISAEALATIQVAPEPAAPEPAPPAKPPQSKKPAPVAAAPKPETLAPPTAETPPPVPAGPATPSVTPEEQPRLQPVYSEEEKRRILAELEKRRNETENLLRGFSRASGDQKIAVDRVRSFMSVAEDAAKRGDLHSADAFSMRALVLARELVSGR
jgi:hypothetical protein